MSKLSKEEMTEKKSALESYKQWSEEFKAAKKRVNKWQKQAEKIVKRYTAQADAQETSQSTTSNKMFKLNMFYSNIVTLESMLYGSIPTVDVMRRYADPEDDISRVAAETMKRLLNSDIASDGKEIDTTLKSCLQDRLLAGLACARVRYELKTAERPVKDQMGEPVMEDGEPVMEEYMVNESAPVDYYFWGDVLWGWSRNFAELPWMAFRNYMTKDEVELRFGEDKAKELNYVVRTVGITDEDAGDDPDMNSDTKKAEVWEIWSKKDRKVCWYNEDYKQLLDSQDDPLELSGFFPAPPFLMANPTTTLYMPTPDYKMAEDLYNEIDNLQTRIAILTEAVKAVGVYDSSATGVQRMMEEGTDNKLIPVDSWAAFSEKGGIRGSVDWMPITDIVNALDRLTGQRNDSISLLQQITGMSDIMRGQLDNQYEGVGQTNQKAKFGSVRVQALQEQFTVFATDLMQIKAEVIARHFDAETIIKRSNMEYSFDVDKLPEAVRLIKNPDRARLGIKIESESMAMVDYSEMRAERTSFLNAVSNFVQSITPIIEQRPEAEPFMLKLMQWGLAGYKGSQQIESLFDKTIEASEKAAKEDKAPTPEQIAQQQAQQQAAEAAKIAQAKTQATLAQIEAKKNADMAVREQDKRADMETAQHQHTLDMEKNQMEAQAAMMEIQAKSEAEQMKQMGDAEANVLQSGETTRQEIEKNAVQSMLKINEMNEKAVNDLKVMRAKSKPEASDNE